MPLFLYSEWKQYKMKNTIRRRETGMEIGKVLAEYDAMFGTVGLDKIEEFLVMKLKEAEEEQDLPQCLRY